MRYLAALVKGAVILPVSLPHLSAFTKRQRFVWLSASTDNRRAAPSRGLLVLAKAGFFNG